MKKLISSLIGMIVIVSTSFAQYDSTYIGSYDQRFALKPIFFYNVLELSKQEENQTQRVGYVPNNLTGVGLGFMSKKTVIEIYYNPDYKQDKRYETTSSSNIQIHNYGRSFAFDAYYIKYKGLHINDEKLAIEKMSCPDLSFQQVAFVGQYIFNSTQFSYQAAYTQNEKQLQSAGSFLLGGGIYYLYTQSDSSFRINNKNNYSSFQWGINGGYAYNWAINSHWLLCGTAFVGLNIANKNVKSFFNRDLYLQPTFVPRLAVNYNTERWSLGLWYVNNIFVSQSPDNTEVALRSGRLVVSYTQRFGKKRT